MFLKYLLCSHQRSWSDTYEWSIVGDWEHVSNNGAEQDYCQEKIDSKRQFLSWIRRQSEAKHSHGGNQETRHDEVEEVVESSPSDLDSEGDVKVGFRTTFVDNFISCGRNTWCLWRKVDFCKTNKHQCLPMRAHSPLDMKELVSPLSLSNWKSTWKYIFYQKTFCKDNQKQKNRTSKFPRGVMMQTKEERKEDLQQQCLLSDQSINANYQIVSIVCLAAVWKEFLSWWRY